MDQALTPHCLVYDSDRSALAMVFKLAEAEQKSWRRLDGPEQLPKLIQGVKFTDGIEVVVNTSARHAQADS